MGICDCSGSHGIQHTGELMGDIEFWNCVVICIDANSKMCCNCLLCEEVQFTFSRAEEIAFVSIV